MASEHPQNTRGGYRQQCPNCERLTSAAAYFCPWCGDGLRPKPESDSLQCDVSECDQLALVRVLPSFGETHHSALRCPDCFEYDFERDWFQQWRDAIQNRADETGGDGS